ncbi:MAG: TonB-dependent receptor plug domain-containing protein [Chitinivibrionales bacterium]
MLVDGIPVTGNVGGGYPLENIEMGSIKRIEVMSGASSSMYGTDAIGGVVNIITETAGGLTPLGIDLGYRHVNNDTIGSWGGKNSAEIGLKHRNKILSLEGFLSFNIDKGLSHYDVSDKGTVKRLAYPEDNSKKILVKSSIYPSENLSIKSDISYTQSEELRSAGDEFISLENQDRAINFKTDYEISEKTVLDGYLSLRSFKHIHGNINQILDTEKEKETFFRDYEGEARINTENLFPFLKDNTFLAGINILNEHIESDNIRREAERVQGALFTSATLQSGDDINFILNPQIRFTVSENIKDDNTRNFLYDLSPKLGFKINNIFVEDLYWRVYYGRSYKIPRLKKMYYSFNMGNIMWLEGNEEIEPEKAHEVSSGLGYVFEKKIEANLSARYIKMKDMVITKYVKSEQGNQVYRGVNGEPEEELGDDDTRLPLKRYRNAVKGYLCGGKLSLTVNPLKWLEISGYYTHNFSKVEDDQGEMREKEHYVPNTAGGNLCLNFELLNKFIPQVNLSVKWKDRSIDDYDDEKKVYIGSYTDLNLNIRKSILKAFTLSIGVNNLLDSKQEGYKGLEYGRTYFAGIDMSVDDITNFGSEFEPVSYERR